MEDAIVVATRKYYKSQENLRAELDKDTGKIRAYAVKTDGRNPEQIEILLLLRLTMLANSIRTLNPGESCRFRKSPKEFWDALPRNSQAGHFPESSRGGAPAMRAPGSLR